MSTKQRAFKSRCFLRDGGSPELNSSSESNHHGDKKILNTTSNKLTFLSASDSFEIVLNQLMIEDDVEVFEKLLYLKDLIKKKLSAFSEEKETASDTSETPNLGCSKSVTSSVQSLCSEASASLELIKEDDLSFKEFLTKVNCPFCFTFEADKVNLIKHLDESCTPLKNNKFHQGNHIHFSAFQILPNDSIKCNVCKITVNSGPKHYFYHKCSISHKLAYSKVQKLKKCTELLFCACCKVLVPNNYTQIHFHCQHELHKTNKMRNLRSPKASSKEGNVCVYLQNKKKFRCLVCPSKYICESSEDILFHFEQRGHKKNIKQPGVPKVFCESCDKEVYAYEVISHFNSDEHRNREKIGIWFEMCYYCGFICKNLMELSQHVKADCFEITCIREQQISKIPAKLDKKELTQSNTKVKKKLEKHLMGKKPTSERKTENLTENKLNEDREIEGGNTTEEPYIIVKGNTEVPKLYKYFQKFGQITSVEIYKENNVLIRFLEKNTVEEILLLRNVIKINGMKMEITADEKLIEPDKEMEERGEEIDASQKFVPKANITSEIIRHDNNSGKPARSNHRVDDLFVKVTSHLSNSTRKLDYDTREQILSDCEKTFGREKCSFVGFSACNLSFPVEPISLYINVGEEVYSGAHLTLDTSGNFLEHLFVTLCIKLSNASEWRDEFYCHSGSFPYIKSVHKATQEACTFTLIRSTKVLTDMLSICTYQDSEVRYFVLLIRFWLSVHNLEIRESEYTIISLLVFFLINRGVIRPFSTYLLTLRARSFYDAIVGKIGGLPKSDYGHLYSDMPSLFWDFLKFLHGFDFRRDVIWLPIGGPIPKKYFDEIGCFSDSLKFEDVENSSMCIVDSDLLVNLSSGVGEIDVKSLLETVESTLQNILKD